MNKKGQFFLIAALIISGIVLAFATVQNFTDLTTQTSIVFDLSEEIDFEANKVIDKGIFLGENPTTSTNNLISIYNQRFPEATLIAVQGNLSKINYRIYVLILRQKKQNWKDQ